MLTYTLEKDRGHSLYAALYEHIRADIAAGRLQAGERLPSKRAFAAHLGVSLATVESAYAQLMAEGYAEARERSGIFVCAIGELPPAAPPRPAPPAEPPAPAPLLDLSSGAGDDAPFPFSVWTRTMREVMAELGKDLLHPVDFRGAPELRRAIADYLYRARGLSVRPEQILIGAGNEYLYGLLVQLLGRDRVYAVEDPGYLKIAGIYRAHDAPVRHIPLDGEGLRADALGDSQIVHISPAHHYPTGIVMPIRRRSALLDWAWAQPGRYIIEDDYDSELRHRGRPVPPLFSLDSHQRVIYLSTFSQTIAPSLRIAYLCLPPHLMEAMEQRLGFYSCSVPTFEQHTLARFIASGDYERHINRLRKRYRDKRSAILDMIAASPLGPRCSIIEESAGTHLLLRLRTRATDAALKEAAAARGLGLRFLGEYHARPTDSGSLILNYACLPLEALPPALETLAELL
ncbi:MAG: PLP-dependent aminotransferase family protein [Oscillospiraceae bacterium]|nr:PLP-dependent aminotransferase family protein [Oscillospiraceae bacterium]